MAAHECIEKALTATDEEARAGLIELAFLWGALARGVAHRLETSAEQITPSPGDRRR